MPIGVPPDVPVPSPPTPSALTLICVLKSIEHSDQNPDLMTAQVLHYKNIDYVAQLKKPQQDRQLPDFIGDVLEPNTDSQPASFIIEGRYLREYFLAQPLLWLP